jgi:hypothetical protein
LQNKAAKKQNRMAELHPEKWIMKMELSYIKDKEQRSMGK